MPQGPARLSGSQARTSEEGDTLSPSRLTEVQGDDDARGQPVCEDMEPLPVVGGVDTGKPLWKTVCWCVSAPQVCALFPGPPPAWLFSQCVVMLSGCIGRMSFPYLSIRREASVTCGTLNTGRCKQTPCKGENRRMKTDVQTWRSVPKVLEVEKPSPLASVERCPDRADPLASFAGSHVRVTQAGGSNMNRVGSGGWQLRSRSSSRADLGSCEGCGESVPSTPSLPGFAGHGGCVWD